MTEEVFKCLKCGCSGEIYFDWAGNCLSCEEEDFD